MMIDPKGYRREYEDASLDELLKRRDRIIEFMRRYENHELPNDYFMRTPGPQTVYFMNMEYLSEINDLIRIRMLKEDFYKKASLINLYREFEIELSKFDEKRKNELLEKLKSDNREFHDGYVKWIENRTD